MQYGYPLFPALHLDAGAPSAAQTDVRHPPYSCNNRRLAFLALQSQGWFGRCLILDHRDIAELKAHRLVGAESDIGGEQNVIVKLFRLPTETGCLGSCARFRVAS